MKPDNLNYPFPISAPLLGDEQKRRYARNISLAGIGEEGQRKLLASRVLVVGAGGLGSPVIAYLAAAGVGHIGIVDDDRVELSNLQRQILYENGDIGRMKTQSARDRVQEMAPGVQVTLHEERLTGENAGNMVAGYDIVADGCDNFATRFAVNSACHAAGKTLVSAAIKGYNGQIALFKSYLGAPHPCYRCFVSGVPGDERGCADAGVLGAFTGITGSMQALEVIKELLGIGVSLSGKLLQVHALDYRIRIIAIPRDPQCDCCGNI